jgi:succinate dehydrogenase / fumarate reductase cytochrome b subunit
MTVRLSNTFLLRKLHQLTGVVPLGVFFLVHMYTNSTALSGERIYNEHVQYLHDMPNLIFVEIFGIFIPLLFHSIYGVLISAEARVNVLNYGYGRNWFYVFQRVTGVFLFLFLLFHILNFRFGLIPGLNTTPVAGNANLAFDIVSAEFQIPWVMAIYVLGIIATAWHLAYGFFLFAVDWGIVIGEKAQRLTLYGCIGAAIFLSLVGINAAAAFVTKCGLLPKAVCESAEKNKIVEPPRPARF